MVPYLRIQSAMEYLMTYGWAILIIAVVLGALFELGVFSGSGLPTACVAYSGFKCGNPELSSGGILTADIGYVGTGITVQGIACTTNQTPPTSYSPVALNFLAGQTYNLSFSCPLSNSAIGSHFNGYLWIVYSEGSQTGLSQMIASISATVSTTSQGFVYCVGGDTGSTGTTYDYYGGVTQNGLQTWKKSPVTYPANVQDQSCASNGAEVFCVGGSGSTSSNSVYYAPISSAYTGVQGWDTAASYPGSVVGEECAFGSYTGDLYCVGGYYDSAYTNDIFYSSAGASGLGGWSAGTPYPIGQITGTSCVTYLGYLYCIGGSNGASVFTTDTYYASIASGADGNWLATQPYPITIAGQPCVISGNIVYCVGGYTNSGASVGETGNVYYAAVGSGGIGAWKQSSSYPLQVGGESCAVVNNYIYCVGGYTPAGLTSNVYYAALTSSGVGNWIATSSFPSGLQYESCFAG